MLPIYTSSREEGYFQLFIPMGFIFILLHLKTSGKLSSLEIKSQYTRFQYSGVSNGASIYIATYLLLKKVTLYQQRITFFLIYSSEKTNLSFSGRPSLPFSVQVISTSSSVAFSARIKFAKLYGELLFNCAASVCF